MTDKALTQNQPGTRRCDHGDRHPRKTRDNFADAALALALDLKSRGQEPESAQTINLTRENEGWRATVTFADGTSVDWALTPEAGAQATSFSMTLPPPAPLRQPATLFQA